MSKDVRRWLLLVALFGMATVIVGLFSYRLQAPHRQRAHFNAIRPGMTKSDVIALMGEPESEGNVTLFGLGNQGPDEHRMVWPILSNGFHNIDPGSFELYEVYFDKSSGLVTGAGRNYRRIPFID